MADIDIEITCDVVLLGNAFKGDVGKIWLFEVAGTIYF